MSLASSIDLKKKIARLQSQAEILVDRVSKLRGEIKKLTLSVKHTYTKRQLSSLEKHWDK